MTNNKPELLSPAGNFDKLKTACEYGADAVYTGGEQFSLRAAAVGLKTDELKAAVDYAHNKGVAVYLAVNIYARNAELDQIRGYLASIKKAGVDAVLVSDPGVFSIANEFELDIHISTQANVTNYQAAEFWRKQGAKRVVLARELSLDDIAEISRKTSAALEAFVHGAMCVSYSGRCLLSDYFNQKGANNGACTHPCRWGYALAEESRPNEYLPIEEDERGTYILSSHDLCMAEHIPKLTEAGVSSFKIEGRMKSVYYTALTTKIYREAIDDYFENKEKYNSRKSYYIDELKKVDNRGFSTGFYYGAPRLAAHACQNKPHVFNGIVLQYDSVKQLALIEQKNKFSAGQKVEFISAWRGSYTQVIAEMYDEEFNPVQAAPHPKQHIWVKTLYELKPFDIMRSAWTE